MKSSSERLTPEEIVEGEKIEAFIDSNIRLMQSEATRKCRYGNVRLSPDEIKAAAVPAYLKTIEKHRRGSTTKIQTMFTFHYKRYLSQALQMKQTTGAQSIHETHTEAGGSDDQGSHELEFALDAHAFIMYGSDRDGVDQIDRAVNGNVTGFADDEIGDHSSISTIEDLIEEEKREMDEMSFEGRPKGKRNPDSFFGSKYLVCIESFPRVALSYDVKMFLKTLAGISRGSARKRYTQNLKHRSDLPPLAADMVVRLRKELNSAGYALYMGVCLNGSCNQVLVAGRTKEEVRQHLKRYGNIDELTLLTPGVM